MIKRLPDHVIAKIAAGEVVERPCSVLKELFENAIDAKASKIEVTLREGGSSFLQVKDNGIGMNHDDLKLCLEPHTTSKMTSEDLFSISTLGFRGEALSSIASVSKVIIQSSIKDAEHGWEVHKNETLTVKPCIHFQGTSITITDLFYAIPARLNFLKSQAREKEHCTKWFQRLSASYPEVTCILKDEKREIYHYLATSWEKRIADLMGNVFMENAILLENDELKGYCTLPSYTHRCDPMFFLNGRFIKDRIISSAIKAAYRDVISSSPCYLFFLTLDSYDFDVNVHPAKTEVRFRRPDAIYRLILQSLQSALEKENKKSISIPKETWDPVFTESIPAFHLPKQDNIAILPSFTQEDKKQRELQEHPKEKTEVKEIYTQTTFHSPPSSKIIGQLHQRYVLFQTEEGLMIVDQHALHERIVYEDLKKRNVQSQGLIIPQRILLNEKEKEIFEKAQLIFKDLGFVYDLEDNILILRSVPALLKNTNHEEWISKISKSSDYLESEIYKVLAEFACHHSIRSGRTLRLEEMEYLIKQMDSTKNSSQCNHGRPTHLTLSLDHIDQLFQRI